MPSIFKEPTKASAKRSQPPILPAKRQESMHELVLEQNLWKHETFVTNNPDDAFLHFQAIFAKFEFFNFCSHICNLLKNVMDIMNIT